MNDEVLERLLIDHDAGELSPDVEELLENHLQQDPAARVKASELSETLQLARLALASESIVALPRRWSAWNRTTWAWRVAACLICAGLIGLVAIRERQGSTRAANSVPAREVAAAPAGDESGFWSAYRLHASVSSSRPNVADRILWKSPVRKPELSSK